MAGILARIASGGILGGDKKRPLTKAEREERIRKAHQNEVYSLPSGSVSKEDIAAKRKELKQAGVKGKERREQVGALRTQKHTEDDAAALKRLSEIGFDTTDIKHPRQFLNKALHSGAPMRRLAGQHVAEQELGLNQPQDVMAAHTTAQLHQAETDPESVVNEREGDAATKATLGDYVRRRFDPVTGEVQGLNPHEMSTIRGRGLESIGGGAADAYRNAGEREAAAGIDPRSGIAKQHADMIQRASEQARAGLERDITTEDLARKGQIENLTAGQAGLEESGRESNVSANLRRLADVEGGSAGTANRGQENKEFELNTAYSAQQAALARKQATAAAKALEPTPLQQTGAVLGGIAAGARG